MKLQEIPFAEVQRIYAENANAALPMQEHEYREIISAEYMVFGRKGLGGPQVKEAKRVITKDINALELDRDKMKLRRQEITESNQSREELFTNL